MVNPRGQHVHPEAGCPYSRSITRAGLPAWFSTENWVACKTMQEAKTGLLTAKSVGYSWPYVLWNNPSRRCVWVWPGPTFGCAPAATCPGCAVVGVLMRCPLPLACLDLLHAGVRCLWSHRRFLFDVSRSAPRVLPPEPFGQGIRKTYRFAGSQYNEAAANGGDRRYAARAMAQRN
jgi:hypothetical protein